MEDCVDTAVWKTKIERFELVVKPSTKSGRGEGTDGMLRGGKEEGGGRKRRGEVETLVQVKHLSKWEEVAAADWPRHPRQ